MPRVLLLGGTTEAGQLAAALAAAGVDAVFSYAGRTAAPVAQPLPTRVGGFGGVAGLVAYLRAEGISHVIDATHPFAARMSGNAVAACAIAAVPLLAYERPAWQAGEGDDWHHVRDVPAAVAALPDAPARVFLAIGKQHLAEFATKPQHHYLLRLVDAPGALPLPQADAVIARGPFTLAGDIALMQAHRTTHVVAKNAGGAGARAKVDAARALRLPVILIDRPVVGLTGCGAGQPPTPIPSPPGGGEPQDLQCAPVSEDEKARDMGLHEPPLPRVAGGWGRGNGDPPCPARAVAGSVAEVMAWLGHPARLGV